MVEKKLNFKVGSGLKDIIGRDLITNENVAIFELVKNSYDAKATEVNIIIDSYNDKIIISDNGEGMSYDNIVNNWLFVAYSNKKNSDMEDRFFAGSKGIGRFSCDRLGSDLTLYSKKKIESSKLKVNWGDFEENSSIRFEELEVGFEEINNKENHVKTESGTLLEISNLRDVWDLERAEDVSKSLERLINPFKEDDNFQIHIKFNSNMNVITLDKHVENSVLGVLDSKTIYIHCDINEDKIKVKLFDKFDMIYEVTMLNKTLITKAEFKIYYLNQKAKYNFSKIMKMQPKDYGSIFLYKNNFRIFPYGEPNYDSFGINLRKNQGYNRYLGHRELLGWINIIDTKDHFKEVTSRDRGFVENAYTVDLENTYMSLIHRPLESYMQLVNFGSIDIEDAAESSSSIDKLLSRFKKYGIIKSEIYELPIVAKPVEKRLEKLVKSDVTPIEKKEIERNVIEVLKNSNQQLEMLKKKNNEIEKENKNLNDEIKIKNKVIESSNPHRQTFLEHELNFVSEEINSNIELIMSMMNDEEKTKYIKQLTNFRLLSDKLREIQKVILKVDIDTKNKVEPIDIKSYLKSYFSNVLIHEINTKIIFDEDPLIREINIFDFGVVLDNLLINAIAFDATEVTVFMEDGKLNLLFDSGPIEVTPIDKIFELGFSTKDDGNGMGMYIVKQIIEEFGWSIAAKNLVNNMVQFVININ